MLDQPSILSVLQRLRSDIEGQATFLLDEGGQIHQWDSRLSSDRLPALGALVAGLIGAGQSVAQVSAPKSPPPQSSANASRRPHSFACDSEEVGVYTVRLPETSFWLAALYDQPLNPGRTRLKVRRAAWDLLELLKAVPLPETAYSMPNIVNPIGDVSPPVSKSRGGVSEKTTGPGAPLFDSLTDDEVDSLFDPGLMEGRIPS